VRATHRQRDEILLCGPALTKGYLNRAGLNEDDAIFTKDGWMGDIRQWDEDKTLSLIDP
jgi:long-subunit acyl-CoA synthetase (AMP-forming)